MNEQIQSNYLDLVSVSKFQTIVIIVLSSIIVGFLNFSLIQTWIESEESRNSQLVNDAYEKGLEDAIIAIFTNTQNCQTTSLYVENITKQIIDMDCINFTP